MNKRILFPRPKNGRIAILLLLAVASACAGRRPPDVPAHLLTQVSNYNAQLAAALERDQVEAAQLVERWTAEQPPLAVEADMYVDLLDQAQDLESKRGAGWAAVAQALVERFPQHPAVWVGHSVLAYNALTDESPRKPAVPEQVERFDDAPGGVKRELAARMSQELWARGRYRASVQWALKADTSDADQAFWEIVFARAWQCCQPDDFADTPVADVLLLREAMGQRQVDWQRSAKRLARMTEDWETPSFWVDLAGWLRSDHDQEELEQDGAGGLTAVLPLNGASRQLGRFVADGAIACVTSGTTLRIEDSKGRPAIGYSVMTTGLAETTLGPLRTAVLQNSALQLAKRRSIVATPNPNLLDGLPATAAIWNSAVGPEDQAAAIADALAEQNWRAVAVLLPENEYGDRFLNMFWGRHLGHGGWFTGVQRFDGRSTDFGPAIRQLVGLDRYTAGEKAEFEAAGMEPQPIIDFDALVIAGEPSALALMPAQLAYYDVYGVRIIGDSGWRSEKVADIAGSYLDKLMFVDLPLGQGGRNSRLGGCDRGNTETGGLAVAVGDGLRFLEAARNHSGRRELSVPGSFMGVSGPVRVNGLHLFERDYVLYQWQRRQLQRWDGTDPLDVQVPEETVDAPQQ